MKTHYTFKPSFLDRMTPIQKKSWLKAAEEVMEYNAIPYQRALLDGQIAYLLDSKNDYEEVRQLSMDIGERALRIEANLQDNTLTLHTKVAGNA